VADQGVRKAQALVRRLAVEKYRKMATPAIVVDDTRMPTTSEQAVKSVRGFYTRVSVMGDGVAQAAHVGRRPWRVGASSTTWATEETQEASTSRLVEKALRKAGAAVSDTTELATAVVERVVNRACLNLANRPWRLAGVRLSIDPPRTGGERRRARGIRGRDREDPMNALVRGVEAAARETMDTSGTGLCVEQGRNGGRGHRHLVRPRTFPDDGRGLWSR
ncbi:unnamed protein product, partial [Ectocarpus sp. 12 AP-2014]